MIDEITAKAWEVFRSAFQDGEDVVVEDDYGRFFAGRLKALDEGIILTRSNRKTKFLEWDEIEFIAHDGFPVRPIMGMSAEEAAKRAEETPREVIRQIMSIHDAATPVKYIPVRYIGGGCPWIAEDVVLESIHNQGNDSPGFWYWPYDSLAEVMVFRATDGAKMQSYDSSHLFLNV